MKTKIFYSYVAFLNREDKTTNGVSKEFAEQNPEFEKQNETNEGCWNCSDCSGCSRCSDCSDCSDLTLEKDKKEEREEPGLDGRKLERRTSTLFAAQQIYNASSPIQVKPPRFYERNEVALADMERCAAEEAAIKPE